jgi:hypothetical protein
MNPYDGYQLYQVQRTKTRPASRGKAPGTAYGSERDRSA